MTKPERFKKIPIMLENKLLRIISYYSEKCIKWNDIGDGFVIYDLEYFTTSILPSYFRVKKFSSFVRRLTKYDFILHKTRYGDLFFYEFKHPKFINKQCKIEESSLDNHYQQMLLEKRLEEIKEENINLKIAISEREQDIMELKEKCKMMENGICEIW